jgi:hypothetical protein
VTYDAVCEFGTWGISQITEVEKLEK